MSNTKQYATATLMYVQDYDETFPMSAFFDVNNNCVATFYWAVAPYVKNNDVPRCPSEPEAMNTQALVGMPCANTPAFTSFATNHALFANGFVPNVATKSLAAVPLSADTIMSYDGNVTPGANQGQQVQVVQARHQLNFNANYADGHARAIQATETGTARQFTVMGPGRTLKTYKVGARGGFYAGMAECLGIPE